MQLTFDAKTPRVRKIIEPRDYQLEASESVQTGFASGENRQLIVLPTGTGKTVVFAGLTDWMLKRGRKVLVLAHREELLEQAREKIGWIVSEDTRMEIEMAEQWAEDAQVVLASVQSIGRSGSKRIERFSPDEFGMVIIDEAHHSTASTYQNVIDHFVGDRNKTLLVGVTATPTRTDEESLSKVFKRVAYQRTMLDMARAGWLVPAVSYRISSTTDLSRVKTTAGDYNLKDLALAVNNEERNTLIVDTYLQKFEGQQALVFATDLEHVERLTEQFNRVGVKAAAITGDLDKDIRRQTISEFKNKEIQIVCNYGVLTEGFDYEDLGLIIQARPTQSALLLTQIVGRANRRAPGKKAAQIIEIVDFHSEKTATVAHLFGFRKDFDCESHDFLECVNKAEEIQVGFPNFNPFNTKSWTEMLARFEYLARRKVELAAMPPMMGGAVPGERTKRDDLYFEDLAETEFFENRYRFTYVGMDKLMLQFKDDEGGHRYRARVQRSALGSWVGVVLQKPSDMPISAGVHAVTEFKVEEYHKLDAVKAVELWILSRLPHLDILLNVNSNWRQKAKEQPCTDKQWAIIERNRLTLLPRDKVSKAEAMLLVGAFFDKKGERR